MKKQEMHSLKITVTFTVPLHNPENAKNVEEIWLRHLKKHLLQTERSRNGNTLDILREFTKSLEVTQEAKVEINKKAYIPSYFGKIDPEAVEREKQEGLNKIPKSKELQERKEKGEKYFK